MYREDYMENTWEERPMLLRQEREDIVKYGRAMFREGLTLHSGGYIACYNRQMGAIAVSPSAVPYMETTPEDVVVMDLKGNKLEHCNGRKPSTEWHVVQNILDMRDDINAVFHCHSKFATTLSTLGIEVPAAYFDVGSIGGTLRTAGYAIYTDANLGDDVVAKMEGRTAVLMANHGQVACGDTVEKAYKNAKTVEFCCEIYWRAKCIGTPSVLNNKEIKEVVKAFKEYVPAGGTPENME